MRLRIAIIVLVQLCLGLAARAEEKVAADRRLISLEDALQMALEADERIAIQEREVRVAGLEKSKAITIVGPRLELTGQVDRPKREISFSTGQTSSSTALPDQTLRANFRVTQPILDARVFPAKQLADQVEGAAREDFSFTVRSALLQVVRDYYNALRAREQVKVAEQTLDLARQQVGRAKARFDAGEARRTEVLRAEVDESQAQRNLVKARNDYTFVLSQLGSRIGVGARAEFDVVAPDSYQLPASEDLSDLYKLALGKRNDLAAARYRVRVAELRRKTTGNERMPKVDLQYDHRFIDPETFSSLNNFWQLTLVAKLDIWDGGQRRVVMKQQAEQIEQAELRVRALKKTIEVEVQQSLLDLRTLRENLKTLEKEVALAMENFRNLSEQARVGQATSLDVSTALTALDRARTDLTRQQFEVEIAKRNLEAATGTFADTIIVKP